MPKTTGVTTNATLLRELEQAASKKMTAEEVREQRVSFVYSAMGSTSQMTRDRVRQVLDEKEGV